MVVRTRVKGGGLRAQAGLTGLRVTTGPTTSPVERQSSGPSAALFRQCHGTQIGSNDLEDAMRPARLQKDRGSVI